MGHYEPESYASEAAAPGLEAKSKRRGVMSLASVFVVVVPGRSRPYATSSASALGMTLRICITDKAEGARPTKFLQNLNEEGMAVTVPVTSGSEVAVSLPLLLAHRCQNDIHFHRWCRT